MLSDEKNQKFLRSAAQNGTAQRSKVGNEESFVFTAHIGSAT